MITGEEMAVNFEIPARDPLGHNHVDGKLRCLDASIILEYKIRDRTFQKFELNRIEFPYGEVESVEFHGGWFQKERLLFKTRDSHTLRDLPGADAGKVELFLLKDSIGKARSLLSLVDLKQSEALVNRRQQRLDDLHEGGE